MIFHSHDHYQNLFTLDDTNFLLMEGNSSGIKERKALIPYLSLPLHSFTFLLFPHPVSMVYWLSTWPLSCSQTSFGPHFLECHHSYSWHFQQFCLTTTCYLQWAEITSGPTLLLGTSPALFPWMLTSSVHLTLLPFSVHWPPAFHSLLILSLTPFWLFWFLSIPVLMRMHFRDACNSPRYCLPFYTLL